MGRFLLPLFTTREIEVKTTMKGDFIMNTNLKEKRVHGGTGWADAIFRYQADSASYAEEMIRRVIRRLKLETEGYQTYSSESGFLLVKNNDIILKMSYNMVEAFRCEEVFAFEKYIENQIKSLSI
jgi:hypothetical protein